MDGSRISNFYNANNQSTINSRISFSRKISRDVNNKSAFKLDISLDEDKSIKVQTENKSFKKSIFTPDKNTINAFNSKEKEKEIVNECFIDNKLKALINLRNSKDSKPEKKLSILNLLNFSIRTNYFLYKSPDFSLVDSYIKSDNK